MAKTVIKVDLSEDGIDKAIKDLEKYKKSFKEKCDLFCQKLAERIAEEMKTGFSGAVVDDLTELSGGARYANVIVNDPVQNDNTWVISANGEDAVWVEFGSGVHHNGALGSSPNPYGMELGFTIGGFGVNGVKDKWAFKEGDETKWTYGTPAQMPMYKAVQAAIQDVDKLAKEVFSG